LERWDVVIVGAGPSGLACGLTLIKKGYKTLIVERETAVGLACKPCAEAITRRFQAHPLFEVLPGDGRVSKIAWVQASNGRLLEKTLPLPASSVRTFSKRAWLEALLREFLEKGGGLYEGCTLKGVDRQTGVAYLGNSPQAVRFRYLVGADGFTSRVRRSLGMPFFEGLVWQADVQGEFRTLLLIGAFDEIPFGYAYLFPQKAHAKVGFGFVPLMGRRFWPDVKALQRKLSLAFGTSTPLMFRSSGINLCYRGFAFENIFLAGEAAGLALDFTGEGIGPAVISGEAVALAIAGARAEAEDSVKWLVSLKRAQRGLLALQVPLVGLGRRFLRPFGLTAAFLLSRAKDEGLFWRILVG